MSEARRIDPRTVSGGYKSYVLGALLVVYIFNFVDRQIVGVLQEPIKAEFGLADWQLGLMTGTAFALFYTMLGLPIARLADRHEIVQPAHKEGKEPREQAVTHHGGDGRAKGQNPEAGFFRQR